MDSRVLDAIYGAAADPDLWPEALEALTVAFDGAQGYISALDVITGRGAFISTRIAPDVLDIYDRHYSALNPINNVDDPITFIRNWSPKILTDNDCLSREIFGRTEYFNDFSLPNDANTTMMLRLGRSGTTPQVLNIGRSKTRGWFETADLELAAAYHPHLIRAAAISRKVAADRAIDANAGQIFLDSPNALFLTNADGRILRVNPAGEILLRGNSGLVAKDGRLGASEPDAARRLHRLIALAGTDDPGHRRGGVLSLAGHEPGAGVLVVSAIPLRQPRRPIFDAPPCVLVCVSDPERDLEVTDTALREAFGLTAAESRVVRALIRTGDLPRAAADLGISPHTAKVHLSRIYEKTGVDRQVSLSRLVLRCAAP